MSAECIEAPRRRRHYTLEEQGRLLDLVERYTPYAEIASQFGRTYGGIKRYAAEGKQGVKANGSYAMRQVTMLLGVNINRLQRWVANGWFPSRRTRIRQGTGRMQVTTHEQLCLWLANEDHWHRWRPEWITDLALREWAYECRGNVEFLTCEQAAQRLCVLRESISKAVREGRLRAVRDGRQIWIRSDWLWPDLPPRRKAVRRPRHLGTKPDAAAHIRRWWGQRTAMQLATDLGVTDTTISRTARALGLPLPGRGWRLRREGRTMELDARGW